MGNAANDSCDCVLKFLLRIIPTFRNGIAIHKGSPRLRVGLTRTYRITPLEVIMPSHGRTSRLLAHFFFTEVCLDHFRVVGDFGGCAFGDLFAVVQNRDAVRNAHDEVHVVFDE